MNIHPIFKKKWFWIGIGALFLFSIIFDITIAASVLVKSLSSGKWSSVLLSLGLLYSTVVVYKPYMPKTDRKKIGLLGKLILLIIAFIAFKDYGFFQTLYFLATVFIFSRFAKFISGIIMRRKQARFQT
jgi:hypothetical protein